MSPDKVQLYSNRTTAFDTHIQTKREREKKKKGCFWKRREDFFFNRSSRFGLVCTTTATNIENKCGISVSPDRIGFIRILCI